MAARKTQTHGILLLPSLVSFCDVPSLSRCCCCCWWWCCSCGWCWKSGGSLMTLPLTPWLHCSQEEPQSGAQCPVVTLLHPFPPTPSPTIPRRTKGRGVQPACCGCPPGMQPPRHCLLTHFLPPLSLLFSSGHPYPSVLSVGPTSRARVSLWRRKPALPL